MQNLYLKAINASVLAGIKIIEIYNKFDNNVNYKSDNSPLTEADLSSNQIINNILSDTQIPIISEENKQIPYDERKNWKTFWLIDPLDGTKEFINKRSDFTVNIALIENNSPVFGVIYIPVKKSLFFGIKSIGSYKIENVTEEFLTFENLKENSILLPQLSDNKTFRVVASKSHFDEKTNNFIEDLKKTHTQIELINVGSSLKLCSIAEGTADIYPRFAPTMEWDIAAGHAIINAAGGIVYDINSNKELIYNKENLLNPCFIAKL